MLQTYSILDSWEWKKSLLVSIPGHRHHEGLLELRATYLPESLVVCFYFENLNIDFDIYQFSSVQLLSRVRLFVTPWTAALQASLSITNSQSLLKLMSIKSVMPSNHLILCRPLLLPPSVFPSIRIFSSESVLHIRLPKYWSFSFSISPSNEYSGLISFRMDWLYLLAVQGNLKSLLQRPSSKASVLWLYLAHCECSVNICWINEQMSIDTNEIIISCFLSTG